MTQQKKQAQIKESASALGWGQKKEKLKKDIQWVVEVIFSIQFLFQSPHRIAYFRIRRRWLRARDKKKKLEQYIAEIIWYRAKTKSAPKLEIKKYPGMEKGRCPILEFQMQNGEQLGTDPHQA